LSATASHESHGHGHVLWPGNLDHIKDDPETKGCLVEFVEVIGRHGTVPENPDPFCHGCELGEQTEALGVHLRRDQTNACEVPSWPSQRCGKSRFDGKTCERHDGQ
jgi:hypothetical protein